MKLSSDFLRTLGSDYGSFYLYDEEIIRQRARRLKAAFPSAEFIYSVKCNPFLPVVKVMVEEGFGFDAASIQEVKMGESLNLDPEKILFSAPGKSNRDITRAMGKSILICDSIGEVDRLREILKDPEMLKKNNGTLAIGLRLNPEFSMGGDSGTPSKFGIPTEDLPEAVSRWKQDSLIKITGIHVHLHSQTMNADHLAEYHKNIFELAADLQNLFGNKLEYINFGSGIGIPFTKEDEEIDVEFLGRVFTEQKEKFAKELASARMIIESGRYAPGPAGTYYTRIMDVKQSRGTKYFITNETLNGFARPVYSHVIEKYTDEPHPAMAEPIYTDRNAFQYSAVTDADLADLEPATICGSTCSGVDIIEDDILLPKLQVGDLIAMSGAGAYAASITPMQFSSMAHPTEILVHPNGQITLE